jgi:hypothetical protein
MDHDLTADEARERILAICDRRPNTRNAVFPGTNKCTYKIGERHCIVGRLAANLGWDMPSEELEYSESVSPTAADCGWPLTEEAVRYLAAVQIIADGNPVVGGRRTWGEVARLIRAGAIAVITDDGDDYPFFEVVDV